MRAVRVAAAIALGGAVLAAGQVWAGFQAPDIAVETRFLGLLASLVVASSALLAPGVAAGVAPLAVTLLWVLPLDGPGRAASVLAVLVLGFAAAVVLALRRLDQGARRLPDLLAFFLPVAFGAQLLFRGERLVGATASLSALGLLAALPVGVALAAALLARRYGAPPALAAALVPALPASGWGLTVTLTLVALAGLGEAIDPEVPRRRRLAALAVALAPLGGETRAAGLAVLAGLSPSGFFASGLAAGLGLLLALVVPVTGWREAFAIVAWLPLLAPWVAFPPRGQWQRAGLALLLSVVAARVVPGPACLAAPLALAGLALPREGARAAVAGAWLGLTATGTALLASYPWLRDAPLADLVALSGWPPGWLPALAVALAATLLAVVLRRAGAGALPAAALAVSGLAGAAVMASLPPSPFPLLAHDIAVLDQSRPHESAELGGRLASAVVVDTHLVHAAELPAGAPVASVSVETVDGRRWTRQLRAGEDTAEWAARRPDVALRPGFLAPPPFRARLEPTAEVFAEVYRVHWQLPAAAPLARLEVAREVGLPAATAVVFYRVELRP
ncbi:MAG TPA: hypothetical protein VF017_07540 [Thermoanaerobaculia bacterium]|nr:hypothetical protein [Thermoanaerobaculia bacterium]